MVTLCQVPPLVRFLGRWLRQSSQFYQLNHHPPLELLYWPPDLIAYPLALAIWLSSSSRQPQTTRIEWIIRQDASS